MCAANPKSKSMMMKQSAIIRWEDITPRRVIKNRKTLSLILFGGRGVNEVAVKLVHAATENEKISKADRDLLQREFHFLDQCNKQCLKNVVEIYGTVDGVVPLDWWNSLDVDLGPLNSRLEAYGIVLASYEMSLREYIYNPVLVLQREDLPENERFTLLMGIINEISKALCDLHSHHVVHGNLTLDNILLDKKVPPTLRVCDFGLSVYSSDSVTTTFDTVDEFQGTDAYAAKEMLVPDGSGKTTGAMMETDIRAFGSLIWEVFAGKSPQALSGIERPDVTFNLKTVPKKYSDVVNSLIQQCWSDDGNSHHKASRCFTITSQILSQSLDQSFDIFFSHAWKDNDFLLHVFRFLSVLGYRVWYDKEDMNHNLEESMFEGIERSSIFLCCLSSNYAASNWCCRELKKAAELKKKIIVLVLNDNWETQFRTGNQTFLDIFTNSLDLKVDELKALCGYQKYLFNSLHLVHGNLVGSQEKRISAKNFALLRNGMKRPLRFIRNACVHPKAPAHVTDDDYINYETYIAAVFEIFRDVDDDFTSKTERETESYLHWSKIKEKGRQLGAILMNGLIILIFVMLLYWVVTAVNKYAAVKWNHFAAESGLVPHLGFRSYQLDAMHRLGLRYYRGNGVTENRTEAAKWFELSADGGHVGAVNSLGECYYHGAGVERNLTEALARFEQAAEKGQPDAMTNLGICFENGHGVEQSLQKAVEQYKLAAEKKQPEAIKRLGFFHELGQMVEKNLTKAVELIREAAELGNVDAMSNLGFRYLKGRGIEVNFEEAERWYRLAANKGHPEAMSGLASYYQENQRNEKAAVVWFLKAAEKGFPDAQYRLGDCYHHAKGVKKNDTEAVIWYTNAANQGHLEAMNCLGDCFRQNIGTQKNDTLAVFWYTEAARKGHVEALHSLGNRYRLGRGTLKNETAAMECYQKAADKRHIEAMRRLGDCYRDGKGTEKNHTMASKWYEKALILEREQLKHFFARAYGKGMYKKEKKRNAKSKGEL